jgi:uncharacterized membrane protein YdjX (TVP38/TMEM64 family)
VDSIAAFIESAGAWTYVLAPLFMVVVAILPIPAEIPAMLNGMVFGSAAGTAITWGGGLVGAIISCELSRKFGRPLAERLLPARTLTEIDRVAVSAGWHGLLALRLIPAVAFTALNWAAGLTAIRRWTFMWTTAIGIFPGALVFTVSGVGLGWFYRANPELAMAVSAVAVIALWVTVRRYRRIHSETATTSSQPEES